MDKIMALTLFQFKIKLRQYTDLFYKIIFPVLLYLTFISGTPEENHDNLLPLFIVIVILINIILHYGSEFVRYRDLNFFVKYKLLGFKPLGVAMALYLNTLIFQLIGIAILSIIAIIVFEVSFPLLNLHNILIIFLIINFFQFSITFLLSSVFDEMEKYSPASQVVFYYQFFLGIFGIDIFTGTSRILLDIFNPIVHGLEAMLGAWTLEKSILHFPMEISILLGLSLVFCIIASRNFQWFKLKQ
ncbi:ABC transporter permease [Natranaerobius thermophilus]|uniref:ABC-2 type transporter n=1 Tax=Natranaerobius thermophilus (strain ATCC BAA-1301 / DSM 18059 / JW/NM-WN-LF) TaxID=457570 RepID=B2A4G5_NATTJ|nr:ABC transporter permease [Natranaerobius thermophilus]ACB85142.1 ABC-2 type transporter [Natranaerobius thermophilus JW/NM-WN-LF]